jgi:hypothetical protein
MFVFVLLLLLACVLLYHCCRGYHYDVLLVAHIVIFVLVVLSVVLANVQMMNI